MEVSKRSEIVGTYLKASNILVLFIFAVSSSIYFFFDHQIGETMLFWGLLIMAMTPLMRTLLLMWIYLAQRKRPLAVMSAATLILIILSGIFLR